MNKLIFWPDQRLYQPAEPVTEITDNIRLLVKDMTKEMIKYNGVGISAPQVGQPLSIFVLLIEGQLKVFINPEILEVGKDTIEMQEGSLSVPGVFQKMSRPGKIVLRYQGIDGLHHEAELIGIWAFAAQHEIDHLNGKLFIDDCSPLKKQRAASKIKKLKKQIQKQHANK